MSYLKVNVSYVNVDKDGKQRPIVAFGDNYLFPIDKIAIKLSKIAEKKARFSVSGLETGAYLFDVVGELEYLRGFYNQVQTYILASRRMTPAIELDIVSEYEQRQEGAI